MVNIWTSTQTFVKQQHASGSLCSLRYQGKHVLPLLIHLYWGPSSAACPAWQQGSKRFQKTGKACKAGSESWNTAHLKSLSISLQRKSHFHLRSPCKYNLCGAIYFKIIGEKLPSQHTKHYHNWCSLNMGFFQPQKSILYLALLSSTAFLVQVLQKPIKNTV